MLYESFDWGCPKCHKNHHEYGADVDKLYKCKGCGNEFYLTFSVQVMEIEHYDKEKEAAELEASYLLDVEVSRDEGKSWEKITIDRRNLNPDASPLEQGDWIRTATNEVYEVILSPNNRLGTKRIGSFVAS